jgi:hypothetical protein
MGSRGRILVFLAQAQKWPDFKTAGLRSRKVGEESTKPPGFTVPHCFYIYNISSDDSAAIQTARAEIYLFTTGTPYKIISRILVLASTGQ